MDEAPRGGQAADRAPDPAASPRLLDELGRLAGAVRHLFGAQWRLFVAELALALLALLQGALLTAAIIAFRRALRWLGLPATRSEIGAMMRRGTSSTDAPAAPDTDRTAP